MKQLSVRDLTHIAIVAALYVVLTITPPLNAISYGVYQFRISEMLNFLAFYHRKYIIAVTIGCMISNALNYGPIDVVVGGASTLVFVTLGVILFSKYQKDYLLNGFINKAFLYFALFFSFNMYTIAAELTILVKAPFFLTWFTTAIGELVSLLVGALIVDNLAKRIDFTK